MDFSPPSSHPPQRKLCLVGDFFNLGDAFLAEVEALYLAGRRKGTRVALAPYQLPPPGMAEHFGEQGLRLLPMRARPIAFLRECLRSDLYIGGGHAVREGVSRGWLLLALAGACLARARGRRVALVGAGVSPVQTRFKRRLWRALLERCHALNVRDEASAQTLSEMVPAQAARVHVSNDVAFLAAFNAPALKGVPGRSQASWSRSDGGVAARGPAMAEIVRRIAVVSPAIDASESREVDADRLVRLVEVLRQGGIANQVCFLAHDIRPNFDGDYCALLAERVKRELDMPAWVADGEIGSRLLDSYRMASVVVTGRLHGLIAGALLNKPVVYTGEAARKLRPFGDRFGFPCVRFDAPDWPADLERAVERLSGLDDGIAGSTLEMLRREACINFE